jgi:sulfide:quinone oxidoreductase
MKTHHQILVIGGGTAGIMTAAQLLKKDPSLDVGIVEPADTHYYQPAWTLVGAGTYDFDKTAKPMKGLIPANAHWIKDKVISFQADQNRITTENSGSISYDYLVVAPGLVMAPEMIEGLKEAMDSGVVCSNYTDPKHVWHQLKNFKGGTALFTQPNTPIKCGGAPQKIMYLAADYLRKHGLASKSHVVFATPGSVIFGVQVVKETLMQVIKRYRVDFKPLHNPVKIDGVKKVAYFQFMGDESQKSALTTQTPGSYMEGDLLAIPFDFMHTAPPQTAPAFVKSSDLVNAGGWLDVNINSMQHNKYPNIFGLGDVAALPTAKTGAAIRKQVPIVVDNIMRLIKQETVMNATYTGYSSCPLVTGYGKMVLAEFDYQNNFTPDPKLKQMLVFNSAKEHWRLWMLKKYMLPYLYWHKMMKGEKV